MEITKKEIEEMADAYVNESTRAYWPTIEKSYIFEGEYDEYGKVRNVRHKIK